MNGAATMSGAQLDALSVGDRVEIFSQSMGGWQPAVVTERAGSDVAVQYGADGDRSRVIDLLAADLAEYFRCVAHSGGDGDAGAGGLAAIKEGDQVEIFSQSMGGWQMALVVERAGNDLALQYGADGDRSRIVDLGSADLADYFRVPPPPERAAPTATVAGRPVVSVGDQVEIYSQSMGGWQPAVVAEMDGNDVALQYGADGDRSRIVDLSAPDLADYFRVPNTVSSRQSSREQSRESNREQSRESSRASSSAASGDSAMVAPLEGVAEEGVISLHFHSIFTQFYSIFTISYSVFPAQITSRAASTPSTAVVLICWRSTRTTKSRYIRSRWVAGSPRRFLSGMAAR